MMMVQATSVTRSPDLLSLSMKRVTVPPCVPLGAWGWIDLFSWKDLLLVPAGRLDDYFFTG